MKIWQTGSTVLHQNYYFDLRCPRYQLSKAQGGTKIAVRKKKRLKTKQGHTVNSNHKNVKCKTNA